MSDYLGNLVARSFDLGEVIQPRPVSLFEPPPVASRSASGHPFGLETVDGEQASGETTFDAQAPARHPLASLPVTGLRPPPDKWQQQPGDLSATRSWRPGQPTGHPPPGLPVQPRVAWPSADKASQPPISDRPSPLLVTASDETSSRSIAEEGRPPALEPVIQQIMIERMISPTAPLPADAASAETGAASRTTKDQRPATNGPSRPSSSIAQPHVRPYLEPAVPIPIKPAPPPEPAPTIQVTIGRVEVRATPPAPASKKQRPKPPVMSLDEYLRQRAGGDRR